MLNKTYPARYRDSFGDVATAIHNDGILAAICKTENLCGHAEWCAAERMMFQI